MKEFKTRDKILKICVYATISVCFILLFYRIIADLSAFYESVAAVVSFLISVLQPVIIGVVIAYVLHRLVAKLEALFLKCKPTGKKGKEKQRERAHAWGVLCAVLLMLLAVGGILGILIPTLVDSVTSIADEAPAYVKIMQKFFTDLSSNETFKRLTQMANIDFSDTEQINRIIMEVVGDVQAWLTTFGKNIIPALSSAGNAVVNFFLGIVFSIYILLNQTQLLSQAKRVFGVVLPEKVYAFFAKVVYNMDDLFFKYLSGKLFTSMVLGVICGIGCAVFGIKYAFTIALILAITNMIPVVGPWLGSIPTVLLALLSGVMEAVILVIIILLAQQIESNVLEPKVQGENIGINSFWVLFGIIVFGKLFGVFGMILALPVCGVIRIFVAEWLEKQERKKALQNAGKDA